jgi:hypothetical protein
MRLGIAICQQVPSRANLPSPSRLSGLSQLFEKLDVQALAERVSAHSEVFEIERPGSTDANSMSPKKCES